MTDAGLATLPDLNAQFVVAEDIVDALKAEPMDDLVRSRAA
jgi:hypothetical protein